MARCLLCESDVPDGRAVCDACGHPVNRPIATRATPEAVARALVAARKDLVGEPTERVELHFARGLLERAEQTEAIGDLGRALELARAARRSVEITRGRARVDDALAKADVALQGAKKAGIETLAFERTIAQARSLATQGDYASAERLLRRVSVRTLDQRRERVLQTYMEKALRKVAYARERGGGVADAQAALADAREALALREYNRIRPLAAKAIEKAEAARRLARAESTVDRAAVEVDAARKSGVTITESRKYLTQAREALRKGVYADIPILADRARAGLRDARLLSAAEIVLRDAEREAAREGRKGAEMSKAEGLLAEAEKALSTRDYARVRALAKDIHDATREAAVLKHARDARASMLLDLEDLRASGVDLAEFESALRDLGKAIEARDLSAARRLVDHARHAAEATREARHRATLDASLRIILMNAARGLDPEVGRELLRQVDDAISLGKPLDIQSRIDEHLSAMDAATAEKLNTRVLTARDEIVKLRQGGIETVAMEGKLADAAIAIQERRFVNADGLLDAVEHDFYTLRENLRGGAAEALGRARGEVEQAEAAGIPLGPEVRQMLGEAEGAYAESRYGDAAYISKSCLEEVQRVSVSFREAREVSKQEAKRARADRLTLLSDRMKTVGSELEGLLADNVNLAGAIAALGQAGEHLKTGDLDEAERKVALAEGIVNGAKIAIRQQAHDILDRMRAEVADARAQGIATPEMEAALKELEDAANSERPARSLRIAANLGGILDSRRRGRSQEQQKLTLEKARAAAGKFIVVKKLIEDLRKADIDIAGAEERLGAAEKALEERAFEDVDGILAGLDETAQDLMDELVSAARNLIDRATARVEAARGKGVDVGTAVALLGKAEEQFGRREFAESIENARGAEKTIQEALAALLATKEQETRRAGDTARAEMAAIRKTIGDLARADISIVGADAAIAKAEAAYEAGRYADVTQELADVVDMASTLSLGLQHAAQDLVRTAEARVTEIRSSGIDPGRADMVLVNAREAIEDGRFVEAIEYKKVIEDILTDAQNLRASRSLGDQLGILQASIDSHASLGADMRVPIELLAKANEKLAVGNIAELKREVKHVEHSIDLAAKSHLDSLVTSLGNVVEEGVALGLDRAELEEARTHAAEAAGAGDLGEVYRLKGDLQERILEAKRTSLLRKSQEEIRNLDDLVVQSERLGIPISEAKSHLDQARQAIEAGDVDGFHNGLTQAKSALEEGRTSHFTQRYETRVHAVSTMIANAKRVGAEIGEVEISLGQAEDALRKSDLPLADILLKQTEVSVGMQISNFIKNRYPNLVVHLPTTGLQANNWNRYVLEVENRGKLPARNVEFNFEGDVEVKGSTPIPELGVNERKLVEVGLKPKGSGDVPLTVDVFYQRMFDENRYELKDKKSVRVEAEGTYLVEDVFLIHSDGRLISHHSRKFREEIDEDIFSGMLTVVQDFIKDSFKTRTHLGIKRLDFGDSKILIERSPHTFLATVVFGHEPQLLPLYLLQILKEVEDKYGPTLEKWTGLLNQLEGVDDLIKQLLLVSTNPAVDMGELSESPITLTAKLIDALGSQQSAEANQLLARAQSALETDLRLAWQFVEQARLQADTAQTQLGSRMSEILAAAHDTVQEMKAIGVDTTQAELLLREAEEASQEKKYDRIREIQQSLHESLERAKGEQAAKRMEIELASLINDIQIGKSQNLDVREAESYLTKIENAIQRRNYRQMEEYLRRAKETLARQRRHTVLSKAKDELDKLHMSLEEAKDVNVDLSDVAGMVEKAEKMVKDEDIKDLDSLLERAHAALKSRVDRILKDRHPRLFLEAKNAGLQANLWNRFELSITNKGDWPAKMVIPIINGPADVEGLNSVDKVDPNQSVSLEFGIKPLQPGTMDLDFEVHYVRPLDDSRNQVTESTVVRVEPEGAYVVDEALLFHADGRLIAHEARAYVLPEETSKVAALVDEAKARIAKSFGGTSPKGTIRAKLGSSTFLGTRGPMAHLVVAMRGQEPAILPLYSLQVLQEIHDSYGVRLEVWEGDVVELPGIRDIVRKILFATDSPGVSLGPLEDSPVSKVPQLMERGALRSDGDGDFIARARSAIDAGGLEGGQSFMKKITDAVAGSTEEIHMQIEKEVLAVKESGTLQLSDEQVTTYVEALRKVLEAAFQAKQRAGIERYWPVSRLAIKAADQVGYDAITAFRKIIVSQSGAKELDIVAPTDTWRGMKIDINVHMDSVSASYKLWAKKIEILLRSQDSWKIKAGLEKGEYSVGIEGQKVRIDPSMVSFVESVPGHVVEEPFDAGIVYLDTRMTPDLLAEGYAREIVDITKEARKEMRLAEDSVVALELVASPRLTGMVKPWRDMIQREANALEVQFVSEAPQDAYVVEATLGQETLYLAIRETQM